MRELTQRQYSTIHATNTYRLQRDGGGKTLLMLPLPFPRYVELFNVHLPRGDLSFALSNYQAYNQFIPTLNDLLERYEVTGEFPNAIRDLLRTGGSHQKFPMMYSATSSDPLPALLGARVPRGLEGYTPFAGATWLCPTMNDRGFLITEGIFPMALLIMFNAPFRSL